MTTQTVDTATLLRPLTHYLDRLPGHRGGRRPAPSTAMRWVVRGLPLPDGTRVRLRAQRVGTRWLTCDLWWSEWVEQLTAAHLPPDGPGAGDGPRSPAARTRAAEAAGRALEELGA